MKETTKRVEYKNNEATWTTQFSNQTYNISNIQISYLFGLTNENEF